MFTALVCVEMDCGARANSITNTSANSKSNMGVISCVRDLCRADLLKIEKSVSFYVTLSLLQKGKTCQQHVKQSDNFCENILMRLN
jgi:hypothetical protein